MDNRDTNAIPKTKEEWKKKLTPEQYRVMVEGETERPFTGKYYASKEDGVYRCAACGNELFSSDAKFDSGTGWPSFDAPVAQGNIVLEEDNSLGMARTQVRCGNCGAHLGHVFDDGPTKTGKRFCMNSVCLELTTKQ